MDKEVIIDIKNTIGEEEWFVKCYRCPKCKTDHICEYSKFCMECGVKVKFVDDNDDSIPEEEYQNIVKAGFIGTFDDYKNYLKSFSNLDNPKTNEEPF